MRLRRRIGTIFCLIAAIAALLLLVPGSVAAQVVEVTPEFEIEPSTETTPWVMYFAVGAAALGALVLLGVGFGYMRFAPKFFGREEASRPPPGARPAHLVRQAAAVRWAPPPAAAHAAAPAAAPAATEASEQASSGATAPPSGEAAVQADAVGQAEAEAPEARPSAKTAEETGEREPPEGQPPAEAPSTETPAKAEASQAPTEAPAAESAPAQAPAQAAEPAPAQAPAQAAPAEAPTAPQSSSALDDETFERVLKEQIDKGVDRRVAEGRARAAAVVAARRKAQG